MMSKKNEWNKEEKNAEEIKNGWNYGKYNRKIK